jgi:hypothetical protein
MISSVSNGPIFISKSVMEHHFLDDEVLGPILDQAGERARLWLGSGRGYLRMGFSPSTWKLDDATRLGLENC